MQTDCGYGYGYGYGHELAMEIAAFRFGVTFDFVNGGGDLNMGNILSRLENSNVAANYHYYF